MKTFIYVLLICLVSAFNTLAQPTNKINYQAVARDASGIVLANQFISIRITVEDGPAGLVLYSEEHILTTNQFGLFTLQIGGGIPGAGNYNTIDWAAGNQWLKVEMDPAGGFNFSDMGESELLTVPYANYAASGGTTYTAGTGIDITSNAISLNNTTVTAGQYGDNATVPMFTVDAQGRITDVISAPISGLLPGGGAGQTLMNTGSQWTATSNLYNDGYRIGMGTVAPNWHLHIHDAIGNSAGMQFSNSNTGTGINDGIFFGMSTPSGEAYLMNYESVDMVLGTNSTENMRIKASGNIGIGTSFPVEKLQVNGAVRIGDAVGSNDGTIRYHNGDFEGYDGTSWESFTTHKYQELLSYNRIFTERNMLVYSPDSVIVNETGYYVLTFNVKGSNGNTYTATDPDYDVNGIASVYRVGAGVITPTLDIFEAYSDIATGVSYIRYLPQASSITTMVYLYANDVLKVSAYVTSTGTPTTQWGIGYYNIMLMKIRN
jgi:hypothetical protein